jgi:hypothetical protein
VEESQEVSPPAATAKTPGCYFNPIGRDGSLAVPLSTGRCPDSLRLEYLQASEPGSENFICQPESVGKVSTQYHWTAIDALARAH